MKKTNALWILILLVMFPQFVETIYSPALPLIAREFGVNEETATLTISFYFIAFAAGVIFWGYNAIVLVVKIDDIWITQLQWRYDPGSLL